MKLSMKLSWKRPRFQPMCFQIVFPPRPTSPAPCPTSSALSKQVFFHNLLVIPVRLLPCHRSLSHCLFRQTLSTVNRVEQVFYRLHSYVSLQCRFHHLSGFESCVFQLNQYSNGFFLKPRLLEGIVG